jgi:hypothetical protein
MECFYHPEAAAVGLCKHCSRGVCRNCAAEREGGVACKGRHEEMVDLISDLVGRNVKLSARSGSTSLLAVAVFWASAAICGYLGYRETADTLRLLFGVMAAVMLVSAVSNTRILLTRSRAKTS